MAGNPSAQARRNSALTRSVNQLDAVRVFRLALENSEAEKDDAALLEACDAAGRSIAWGRTQLCEMRHALGWQAQTRGEPWVLAAWREGRL